MKIEKSMEQDVLVIDIIAELLGTAEAPQFKQTITPMLEGQPKVLLDLQHLQFVDSSGCGALLSCIRKVNSSDGELKICNTNKRVRTLFELIRMHKIVEIRNTRQEALDSF